MNTGLQDSINLAWKLAAVIQEKSPAGILDTYSVERVADARQICIEAGRSTRMVAPPSRGYRVMQQAVLSLSLNHAFTQGLLHWRTSHPIDYAESPLTHKDASEQRFHAGPRPGAPARNVQLLAGRYLLDTLEPAFNVLVFGLDAAGWQRAREDSMTLRQRGVRVRLIAVAAHNEGADAVVPDPQGRAAQLWDAQDGAVYVLRPDQHVCARWKADSNTRILDVIERALGNPALAAIAAAI